MTKATRCAAWVLGLSAGFATLTGFRPDDPDSTGLFKFEPGYDVEHFDGEGGRVRVHFTRTGPDKVASLDNNDNGLPDSVEQVAADYEEVLAFYAAAQYREPVSDLGNPLGDGGSDRLDLYLIDFAGQSDGAFVRDRCAVGSSVCSGYVAQENDFAGYGYPSFQIASHILASHELFHAVQAAYDADQGANWSEATATWASEHFDPSLTDFEYFIRGWFAKPDRSIDQEPIGPVDNFSYGLAIFARYLSERFGDDIIRAHWEDLEDGARGVADPQWLPTLIALVERDHATTFDEVWVEFAQWALRSGQGQVAGSFANAAAYPKLTREEVGFPFEDERLRVYRASLQVWGGSAAGRTEVHAALASEDPTELEQLTLIIAVGRGPAVTHVVATESQAGVLEAVLATSGADDVTIAVVSSAVGGPSKRPGLCIGDAVEVAACVAARLPTEVGPDAAPNPEAVEAVDVGPDERDTSDGGDVFVEPSPSGGSSGCSQGPDAWWGLALLTLLVHGLRRRAPQHH